jgi:hypothetical protein
MSDGYMYQAYKAEHYLNIWPVRGMTTPPAQLWKTGQTRCYDTSGSEINCAGTGQDGEIQAGVTWPVPRFTDHENGTLTDNLTGLMWTKDANLAGSTMTWQQALDYIAGMNNGTYQNFGYDDWRLPNINELESLINAAELYQYIWLISQGFDNVQWLFYWSSSSSVRWTNFAYYVHTFDGYIGYIPKYDYEFNYVWPVRGGQ